MAIATNRTATEFLSQYLEISGFNKENGSFMICKEFLDNAVDACTKKRTISPRFLLLDDLVELNVLLTEKYLAITCRDTGIGIDCQSVAALGEVFSSSKADDEKTGGEFGIGLKAIMMYSQRDMGEPVYVKIRMNDREVWTFAMVLGNTSSAPDIINFLAQNITTDEWPWITEFSIKISPLWDKEKEEELEAYCSAYTIWRQSPLIKTNLPIGGDKIYKYIEGRISNKGGKDYLFLAAANACAKQENANIRMKAELHKKRKRYNNNKQGAGGEEGKEGEKGEEAEGGGEGEGEEGEEEGEEGNKNKTKEIILLRSFNEMPLLPSAASACLLTNSLRAFLDKYGQYYGIEEFSSDVQADKQTDESTENIDKIAYRFRVNTAEENLCWSRICLAVDIRSNKSLFCSFAKSHLQGETSIRQTIISAFECIFTKLQKKFPMGFISTKDIARRKACDVFGPSMACSLSGIICASNNQQFKKAALTLLSLDHLAVSQTISSPLVSPREPRRKQQKKLYKKNS